jgi:SMC interacting uncharacterized protein involved in chromosome segregation
VQVLKDLKYPTDVGKTALGAPGSPTNWPTILVMLVWLSELAKVRAELETCLFSSIHPAMAETDPYSILFQPSVTTQHL